MARLDVYRPAGASGYLLDCQADVLRHLNTRFVVPLLPPEEAPRAGERLNPSFLVAGETVILVTQFAASVEVRNLGDRVTSLNDQHLAVGNALDMLINGF